MIHDDVSDQIKEEISAIEEVRVLLGLMNWPQAMQWFIRDYSARNVWGPHLSQDEQREIQERIAEDSRPVYEDATSGLESPPKFHHSEVELGELPDEEPIREHVDQFTVSISFQEAFGNVPDGDWAIHLVPLECLVAYQPIVTTSAHQEIPTSEDGFLDIVRYCLPIQVKNYLLGTSRPTGTESVETQFVSRSPNVNLVGPSIEKIEDRPEGNISVTFNVQTRPNFVQATHFRDRYILKNGYHRCFQLLNAGEKFVPAVVREVSSYEDTGAAGVGWFPDEMILGVRPPLVWDFKTEVAVDLESKVQNKMIRIRGDKFDIDR